MTDLFGNEEPAWRLPRQRSAKPSWTRVHDKGKCDLCYQRLSIQWGQPLPFKPAGHAVWCRRAGGEVQYLCEECATPLRTKDEKDYPRRAKK